MSHSDCIAIVAHDAGGAEILSSYVRRQDVLFQRRCKIVAVGPAQRIFETKLGPIERITLAQAVAQSSSVLCGTGWQSNVEFEAIALARQHAIPSVAFLDHWVNYRQRFLRAGAWNLPDEIWVGDAMAYDLARTALPSVPVRLVENPYFLDIAAALAHSSIKPSAAGTAILYVCEPVREPAMRQYGDEQHFGYTEEDALRYFLDNIAAFKQPVTRILIRPHPAEPADKYDWVAREYGLPLYFSDGASLVDEIAASHCVAGCNSMAMVMGLLGGREVVCCIPPGGHPCVLPQPAILHLQQLVGATKSDN